MKSRNIKFLGILIILLIWIFSLFIVLVTSLTIYGINRMENSEKYSKTDVIKVMRKIHHIQLGTIEGVAYDAMTSYSVKLSSGEIRIVTLPGINNYKPGAEIEISYVYYDLIDLIEVLYFNADTESDTTIIDSGYEYNMQEYLKDI